MEVERTSAQAPVVTGTPGRVMEDALRTALPRYDWDSQHFSSTPQRFTRMLRELTTPESFVFTTFESDIDEMVVLSHISFYTFCAHHIIPFFGEAHVAYVPNGKLCGLSKIARVVESCCRSLNVQEELTADIADFLEDKLEPKGVAVVMEAEHLCMTMRGVKAAGTRTTTSAMRGVFLDPTKDARPEFLQLIGAR